MALTTMSVPPRARTSGITTASSFRGTAAFTAKPAAPCSGAMVGSRGTAELAPLVRFGFHFGAAFQIRDDLLNLVGDEQMYGKEILGDLYEGKRTLPLVHLLSTADGEDLAMVRDHLQKTRAERSPERSATRSRRGELRIRCRRIAAMVVSARGLKR